MSETWLSPLLLWIYNDICKPSKYGWFIIILYMIEQVRLQRNQRHWSIQLRGCWKCWWNGSDPGAYSVLFFGLGLVSNLLKPKAIYDIFIHIPHRFPWWNFTHPSGSGIRTENATSKSSSSWANGKGNGTSSEGNTKTSDGFKHQITEREARWELHLWLYGGECESRVKSHPPPFTSDIQCYQPRLGHSLWAEQLQSSGSCWNPTCR